MLQMDKTGYLRAYLVCTGRKMKKLGENYIIGSSIICIRRLIVYFLRIKWNIMTLT